MTAPRRPPGRVVVSLCGPSGAGKSQLAKALAEHLGTATSVRVPGDYYLVPASEALEEYLRQPLQYDWALLGAVLAAPDSQIITTPNFDFARFQRRTDAGGKTFTMRHIAIIDAMYPYPWADLRIMIAAPGHLRQARVAARDTVWGTRVARRWAHLELARAHLDGLNDPYDAVLPGTDDLTHNTEAVVALLSGKGYWS